MRSNSSVYFKFLFLYMWSYVLFHMPDNFLKNHFFLWVVFISFAHFLKELAVLFSLGFIEDFGTL